MKTKQKTYRRPSSIKNGDILPLSSDAHLVTVQNHGTNIEHEILCLHNKKMSAQEIASRLFVGKKTKLVYEDVFSATQKEIPNPRYTSFIRYVESVCS